MRTWALPAALIVAFEYAAALIIGAITGFHYTIPFQAYLVTGLIVGAGGSFLIIGFRLMRRDFSKPLPWGFAAGALLVALQIAVLNWTKVMLPLATSFWADPFLAEADAAIFRMDPWRLAHMLFSWAGPFADRAYVTWAPIKFATLIFVLAMPEDRRKTRALLAYFMIAPAGALGQYLLPSAGPIFYERIGLGDRFADLPIEPWVASTSAYLWHDFQQVGGHVGGGISAMPSMHVAVALWIAFVTRSYFPKFKSIGFAYFALIFIGSIYLGWHYALDSFAAISIACLAWAAAKRFNRVESAGRMTVRMARI